MSSIMNEVIPACERILKMDFPVEEKKNALELILALTKEKTASFNILFNKISSDIANLLSHSSSEISKLACSILVNVSSEQDYIPQYFQLEPQVVTTLLNHIFQRNKDVCDLAVSILCNISRSEKNAEVNVIPALKPLRRILSQLVDVFVQIPANEDVPKLHNLALLFTNLSQSLEVRKEFLEDDALFIRKIMVFSDYHDSQDRRQGVLGTIRNCCFARENHLFLLSQTVDILPYLLLPLAGESKFDEEDTAKLPQQLRNLPGSKQRETCASLRVMALETLYQLCATRPAREILREKNAYVILRELHKEEEEKEVIELCEDVVNMIIRTEDEIGVDDLSSVEIPKDVEKNFNDEAAKDAE